MATGRIFKITKEQAGSYELLKAPSMRPPRRARANPGVTAIMGISNPARRVLRNPDFPFIPRPGMVLGGRWVVKEVSASLKRVTIYMPQDKDYGHKMGKPLTFSWDEKMGTWKRQGQAIPTPGAKENRKRATAKRASVKRPIAKLSAVKKTQMIGGIRCLAKPAAKWRREGLNKRTNYALPQCFRYPVQKKTGKPDPKLIRRALSYYGRYKSRYSKAVRDQIERGIAKAAKGVGLESPKAMQYRRKFGLANPGEDNMIVMRKNAARKKAKKRYGVFREAVLFPAWGKGAKGISGRVYKFKKKKATKRKTAKKNPRVKFTTKSGEKVSFMARGPARRKKSAARKKPATRKKAAARRKPATRKKIVARRKPATRKKTVARKKPATRKRVARTRVTSSKIRGRMGKLRAYGVSRRGGRTFKYVAVTGAKRVSVKRSKTTRGCKSLFVAMKNYDGKPVTWYRNKTKAVANMMRNYAMQNPDAREAYWAEQERKAVKPKTRAEMVGTAGRGSIESGGSWEKLIKDDTAAAAAAAATGVAMDSFSTRADFEKWLAYMLRTNPKFRGVYASWLRKKRAVKKAGAAKKGKKMATRKRTKKRTAKRKPRTTRKQCKKLRPRTKKHYSCISRLPRTTKKERKPAKRRKAKGRKPARRARRNMSMQARANQMFDRLTALAKPTGFIIGGFIVHRLLTGIAKGFLAGMMSDKVASVVTNLAVLGLGSFASMKALPANSTMLTLGMATNAGLSLIADLFPEVKSKLGLGISSEDMRARYVLDGFGQPIMEASAGFGQPWMQAAAGPMGEYFGAGALGEYVSNDLYPAGEFGEYVASNLDIQGYGDYEIQNTYSLSGGGGYLDDGVRPDGDLAREFAFMEAKAGVGQEIMQAAAGLPDTSTYVPSQQAGLVRHSETSYDAGIFDIGGGNGILS